MSKLYNKNYNPQANKIRTTLLILSNDEISKTKKNNQQSNFLLNSKELETYETSFENFIILEHDNISCHEANNSFNDKDVISDFLFQYNQKEISPIEIKQKKKVLTKHPEKLSPNKSIDSNENFIKKSKTKKEEIYNNYIFLKHLCNHFKSSIKIESKRRNSVILRREKYLKCENTSLISTSMKNNVGNNKKEEIKEKDNIINKDNEVIFLHKLERNKKKRNSLIKKNYVKRYTLNIIHNKNGLFSFGKENDLNLVFNG